jgi:ATP-dependent Clp protease ATP-binding subunit ClpA
MTTVDLPALISDVRSRAAGSLLDQIEAALAISDDLQAGADELVGHFVTQARQSGCSWTEIGQRLGVSKQAARQRFITPTTGPGELPVRPRLEACREAAHREAAEEGAAEVGSHHLLVGLFEEGTAASVMEQIGLRRDEVREAGRELFPASGEPREQPPAESAEVREALTSAVGLALRAGCSYVGTGHLLGALAFDPGSRARRVLIHMNASLPAIKRGLECYISPSRRRRRRGKSQDDRCSFCGKSQESGVEMVAGPGVWICADCVALAGEILVERGGGQR